MGWILRRGIECWRSARVDWHLLVACVIVGVGRRRLGLSHWARRARVVVAMVAARWCEVWFGVVTSWIGWWFTLCRCL